METNCSEEKNDTYQLTTMHRNEDMIKPEKTL